ncbi:MAG: methyltransferase domain-containing protein [Candidatus Marinimicrobia bacterium]|nr:methyltransferase domain-containing protein [Candidatus Neomarinimicrobiota bacterium]
MLFSLWRRRKKENLLLKAILRVFENEPRGRVLDFGAAQGMYSIELHRMGFDVVGVDVTEGFQHKDLMKFVKLEGQGALPFQDDSFDLVLMAEVIEHLKDPYGLIKELGRILKKGGKIILSTPNILNLKSRFRYLIEGAYEYFREPPIEHAGYNLATGIDVSQVHVMPWRFHELEYLLKECGFRIEDICTSVYEGFGYFLLLPFIRFQLNAKANRSIEKGGVDYRRINKILLTNELLYGRHLIIKAEKNS